MVVFTCGHCGESVNKPKVEKHYLTKCRNRSPNLSCMDCFKDFFGKEYEQHNKCVTEEQRYAAKGFVAKEKKGEQKQNVWVELVQSVLEEQPNAPKNVLRILESVSKHNNTPRKKPKFINFVKNICGHKTNPKDIDSAWDFLSVKLSALAANNQNKNAKPNGITNGDTNNVSNGVTNGVKKEDSDDSLVEVNNITLDESQIENGTLSNVSNGHNKENDIIEEAADVQVNGKDKKSKKQRKEEKKRQKYEAELKSASEPQADENEEEVEKPIKKEKKKNRTKSLSNGENPDEGVEDDNSNKKRKRQVTVSASSESNEASLKETEEKPAETIKISKKKPKVDMQDTRVCLHDQNVANNEELVKDGSFNWHAVIISVLQKKGNEIQFKRLQKKVLGEYSEATGQVVDDRIAEKFIKKLKSAPKVRVDKNRVLLLD